MVIGEGICAVFILRFFRTPRGAVIIELMRLPLSLFKLGKVVSKWGVNPTYPSTLTNPTYKVELARVVYQFIE
jgi:hypothetical protein